MLRLYTSAYQHIMTQGDPTKFKGIYCIPSVRLKNWDYASPAWYFVTICTHNRECLFSNIVDDKIRLSKMGEIVDQFWKDIPQHFSHVALDASIVMPNHVHGIVVIQSHWNRRDVALQRSQGNHRDVALQRLYHDGGDDDMSDYRTRMREISPNPGSLAAIIRSYKSACTKTINAMQKQVYFAWQKRFHDHIIRDADELLRIREYIVNNPLSWELDRNHPHNIGNIPVET